MSYLQAPMGDVACWSFTFHRLIPLPNTLHVNIAVIGFLSKKIKWDSSFWGQKSFGSWRDWENLSLTLTSFKASLWSWIHIQVLSLLTWHHNIILTSSVSFSNGSVVGCYVGFSWDFLHHKIRKVSVLCEFLRQSVRHHNMMRGTREPWIW